MLSQWKCVYAPITGKLAEILLLTTFAAGVSRLALILHCRFRRWRPLRFLQLSYAGLLLFAILKGYYSIQPCIDCVECVCFALTGVLVRYYNRPLVPVLPVTDEESLLCKLEEGKVS